MQLRINIKPKIINAPTKKTLLDKIQTGLWCHTFSNGGNYLHKIVGSIWKDDFIRIYTLQKYRRKTVQDKHPLDYPVGGREFYTHSKIVRQAHWQAHVYDIPVELLKFFRVEQGSRTFKLIPR